MKLSDVENTGGLYSYSGIELEYDNTITLTIVPPRVSYELKSDNIDVIYANLNGGSVDDYTKINKTSKQTEITERIRECVTDNLESFLSDKKFIDSRLEQKSTIRIPIEHGYKIREPLSDYLRDKYLLEKNDLIDKTSKCNDIINRLNSGYFFHQ